jgi:7,8-dihydroneopterin aldolase/epimerase/oxygenase
MGARGGNPHASSPSYLGPLATTGLAPHNLPSATPLPIDWNIPVADSLILEVADFEVDVLTGIYSEETGKPQPLRISIQVKLKPAERYLPDTPLSASKNYMDLKFAASGALPQGVHFTLIEAVGDHIAETLFLQDDRIEQVTVKIVKLAIAEGSEQIGMTLTRERR